MALSLVPLTHPNSPVLTNPGQAVEAKPKMDLLRLDGDAFTKRGASLRLVEDGQLGKPAPGAARFFCLHIPHFPAWVELQADSALREIPFAVQENGVIIAASPMARRKGVAASQSTTEACGRCPRLRLMPRSKSRESVAWQEVLMEVARITPCVENLEQGLLMADASKPSPLRFAALTREWRVPAGMAADRATAHLAAMAGEPGRVRHVNTGHEIEFARATPVTLLSACGLPAEALARMHWFGWNYVESLRALSLQQMHEQFDTSAELLWRYTRGARLEENTRPVNSFKTPDTVDARREFLSSLRGLEECETALVSLLRRALSTADHRQAQTVEIVLETPLGPLRSRRVLREPVTRWGAGAMRSLEPIAQAVLREALGGKRALNPVVTAMEVRLGGFREDPPVAVPNRELPRVRHATRTTLAA